MNTSQKRIVGAVVGVLALIVLVKHFTGSSDDERATPQKLALQQKSEHGGWNVRSNSDDIGTSDDVKVQRQAEAKPANIAPPRAGRPPEGSGEKPVAGSGDAAPAAEPDSPNGEANDKGANPDDVPAGAQAARPAGPNVPNNSGAAAPGGVPGSGGNPAANAGAVGAGGAPVGAGANEAGTPNSEPKPPQEQAAQATPQAADPESIDVGAVYDSKDKTFAIDAPTQLKDLGNLPSNGVTMTMNLVPNWSPDNQDDADFLKLGDNLSLLKNVNFLRLEYTDANGVQHSIGTDMTGPLWQDIQQPYSMAATVVDNQMALVVNGKLVAHGNWDGQPYEAPENPTLGVGCVDYPASRPCATGAATGVMVLPPLSPADSIARTKPPNAK